MSAAAAFVQYGIFVRGFCAAFLFMLIDMKQGQRDLSLLSKADVLANKSKSTLFYNFLRA